MKRFYLLTILCALLGVNQAWAGQAHVYVYSSPAAGGYVKVQTSNSAPSSYTMTKDDAEQGGFMASGNKTFYLFYQVNTGYKFQNWYKTDESNYNNATTLTNTSGLTAQGQSVTQTATGIGAQNSYYAGIFAPINYYIAFHAAEATDGSMSNQKLTYDKKEALTKNAFERVYVVTFNAGEGESAEASLNAEYEFAGWATTNGDAVVYTDEDEVENLTPTENEVIDLYAKWNSASIQLPSATRAGFVFAGWYDNDNKLIGIAGTNWTPTEDVTLTARWESAYVPHFGADGAIDGKIDLNVGGSFSSFDFRHTTTETPVLYTDGTSAKFYFKILSQEVTTEKTSAENSDKVITFDGTTITALNQGTATIKFFQEADNENNILAGDSTYTIEVEKNTPTFTWNTQSKYYYNDTIAHFFKSNNTDTKIDVNSSEDEVAVLVDSALVTYNKAGTARITVTQAENYYWREYSEHVDITPEVAINHVPFTISNDNYAALEYSRSTSDESKLSWNEAGYYRFGDGTWGTSERPDGNVVLKFEGIPGNLSFTINCEKAGVGAIKSYPAKNDYQFNAYESATGNDEDWTELNWGFDNSSGFSEPQDVNVALSSTTRYIKLRYKGSCWGHFENIQVTERKQFAAENVNFGDVEINSGNAEKTLTFKHINAGYNVSVKVEEEETKLFSINPTTVANTGGDKMGEEEFTVTFNPSVLGQHTATVTFSDKIGNSIEVTLNANVIKKTPVVTAPTAKEVTYNGEEQQLVNAGATNGGELQYRLGSEGEWSTAIPKATNAGNFVVWYKVVGNETYYDVDPASVDVNVAKADAEIITIPESKELTYSGATKTLIEAGEVEGGELQYSLDNENYSTELPTAINAGAYKVYYKVVGDDNHNGIDAASIDVTIAKASQTIVWEAEDWPASIEVGYEDLRLTAYSSGLNMQVSYESSDNTVAYVDENNYVVALKTGTVTLAARQDGNDNYEAAEPVVKQLTVKAKEQSPTGIDETEAGQKAVKVLRDGKLYIIRGEKVYTINGLEVR